MNEAPDVLSLNLPETVRMALWIPVDHGEGTFFTCQLHGCGHVAQGTSRSKRKALGYALEELSRLVLRGAHDSAASTSTGPEPVADAQPSGGAPAP